MHSTLSVLCQVALRGDGTLVPRLGEMQPPACAADGFGAEFVPEVPRRGA